GSFTSPRLNWSCSSLRTEATGYGLVFFAQLIIYDMNKEPKGLRRAHDNLCKQMSTDVKGYLVDEDEFDYMKLSFLRDIKAHHRTLRDFSKTYARVKYYAEAKPWNERCDVAFPCSSQNKIDHSDAINLVNFGCVYMLRVLIFIFAALFILVTVVLNLYAFSGSNMPCTPKAMDVLKGGNVLIAPCIAAGTLVAPLEFELSHHMNTT
nr:hypothetical protein [Tanacetum cinerariifolium]